MYRDGGARPTADRSSPARGDVVWLSPVYRSPRDDNGYDVSNYQDLDKVFGSLADMERLPAGAHTLYIRIVMDSERDRDPVTDSPVGAVRFGTSGRVPAPSS